jgi:iron(III) transport system permease protein
VRGGAARPKSAGPRSAAGRTSGPRAARITGWLLAGLVVYLPLTALLLESFSIDGRASLDHYRQAVSGGMALLFLRSAAIASGATAIALVLGTLLAYLLETRLPVLSPLLRVAALSPLLLPPYMQVAVWRPLLAGGLFRDELPRLLAAIGLLGFSYSPLIFFFASQGIRSIPREVLEAARLAPVPAPLRALRITLPLAGGAIAVGAALVFVLSFLEQETPALFLVNGYPTYLSLSVPRGAGVVFAAALPAMLLLLLLIMAAGRLARRRGFALTAAASPRAERRPGRGLLTLLFLALTLGLLVGFPLFRLFLMAGSLERFSEAFQLYGRAILYGLPIHLGVAAAAVLLAGLTLPWSGNPSTAARALAWLPFMVPGTALGAGLIEVYNRPVLEAVYGSRWILVVAGTARLFPIAYHALAAHLRTVPSDLWDAARLVPMPAPARLARVYLPLAGPGLALALGAVVLLQSGELAAAILVAPPGERPVSVVISSELHYNVNLEVPAALCLLQVATVLLLLGAIYLLGRMSWTSFRRRSTGAEME